MRKGQRQPGSTLGVRHNQNKPRSLCCVSPGVGNSLQGTQAWDVRGVKPQTDTSPGSGVSYGDRAPCFRKAGCAFSLSVRWSPKSGEAVLPHAHVMSSLAVGLRWQTAPERSLWPSSTPCPAGGNPAEPRTQSK